MKHYRLVFFLFLSFLFYSSLLCGQCISCGQFEKKLITLNSKVSELQTSHSDSLEFYSTLISNSIKSFIENNPSSLDYKFQALMDSRACIVTTSKDGLFRIYSWDDQLGGTMRFFQNIFQFKSDGQVFTKSYETKEGDSGSFYSTMYTFYANNLTYYLAINNSIGSSKDLSQTIKVFSIDNKQLNDTVRLIKTSSGLRNKINVGFDFFSVVDRPERPIQLIKYDENKNIIYIPIVLENGKVTDRFILYQFNGQYFEKILTQRVADKQTK